MRALASLSPAAVGSLLLALGCSGNVTSYSTEEAAGSVHMLLRVERSTARDESAEAAALVGFLRVPAQVDPSSALELLDGVQVPPPLGQCASRQSPQRTTLTSGAVTLLEAGELSLASNGQETPLAPRAFPTVSNLLSGVVYTTTDRAAETLPAGSLYYLQARRGSELSDIDTTVLAPEELEELQVLGTPWARLEQLPVGAELSLSWRPGSPTDWVVVELEMSGAATTWCAFKDDGLASVPLHLTEATPARLSVRRVRLAELSASGLASGLARFEFERFASVELVPTEVVD